MLFFTLNAQRSSWETDDFQLLPAKYKGLALEELFGTMVIAEDGRGSEDERHRKFKELHVGCVEGTGQCMKQNVRRCPHQIQLLGSPRCPQALMMRRTIARYVLEEDAVRTF